MRAKLIEWRELYEGVRHFVFEAVGVERFVFTPGQFVSFHQEVDGIAITRPYSIVSAPDGNRFDLCLNRVEDGHLSPHLFAMQPGDSVEMSGPLGFFTLRHPDRGQVFVATGTGIAPFRSMLIDYLGKGGATQIHLLYGVRFESHLMYRDDFERLSREHTNFQFWPTLSRPDDGWTGRTGHVQRHLDEAIDGRDGIDVYICGLKLMVDDVRGILKGQGFDRKRIIYEKYD